MALYTVSAHVSLFTFQSLKVFSNDLIVFQTVSIPETHKGHLMATVELDRQRSHGRVVSELVW